MPVSIRISGLALGFLLGSAGVGAPAYAQSTASSLSGVATEAVLHLRGSVVDGVTGRPLARALVVSGDRRLATMTNTDGNFTLDLVPQEASAGAGELRLFMQAQRPGYVSPGPVVVRLDKPTVDATLKLMPTGTISGRVRAETQDGPANVTVMLLWRSAQEGDVRWVVRAVDRTDRNGAYRFADVHPGEYTVMTPEWRGEMPLPSADKAITEQYPPVFFGDTANLDGATRLKVRYGDALQADLHLHIARYYPVTVPVEGAPQGVNVQVDGGAATSGFRLGYDVETHSVEGSLPTGTYALQVTGMGQQQSYGAAVLHVADAPLRTAPLALVPALPITVRFHTEYSGKQTPQGQPGVRVYLQPQEVGPFATASPTPGQSEAVLNNVAPGRYTVRVEPSYGYVASVRSGGLDLLGQPLVVSEGEAVRPIDVTLRDDLGKVSGTVAGGEGTLPDGIFLSLLPSGPGGKFATAGLGSNGKFSFDYVVPGNYLALAAPGPAWQIPWGDPDALRALTGKSTAITVAPGSTQQIEVPLADASVLELP